MSPPTAASILNQLDAHRLGAQMAALAALDTAHQTEVRRALAAIKGSARIDVPKLIESVRRSIAERVSQRPAGQPWRYALTLMDEDQLVAFRQFVREGTDPDAAARRAMESNLAAGLNMRDAKPDDDLGDKAEGAPPKRKSTPRRRLLRAERLKPNP